LKKIRKTILVLVGLGAFAVPASAVGPDGKLVPASDRLAALPTPNTEALAANLRELLIQELPDSLFEDQPGWGRTASAASGLKWKGKGLHGHLEVMHEDKNHGTWRKIRISPVNLPGSLVLDVRDIHKLDQGRTQFDVAAFFDARMSASQQNWIKGIKLYEGSLRARFRIKLGLRCEVTTRVESNGESMPDMIFRLRVTQADVNYDHFVTEHIAGLGGDAARLLGDALQKALRPTLQKKILPKANTAIVKAADTKEVRLSLASLLK
jgi:hypothetical protein